MDELEAIVERAQLCDDDRAKLQAALDTLVLLTNELEMKGASIRRLRKLLFGSGSEKLDALLREIASGEARGVEDTAPGEAGPRGGDVGDGASSSPPKRQAPGHGRNGASAYRGAVKVICLSDSLSS